MSPLINSPALGYQDWQRTNSLDNPPVYNAAPGIASGVTTPIGTFNMSRYESLILVLGSGVTTLEIGLVWYADAGLTVPVGQRDVEYDTSGNVYLRPLVFTNVGPWCTLTIKNTGGLNYPGNVTVIPSSRNRVSLQLPGSDVLLQALNQAIAANTTSTLTTNSIYAGPVQYYFTMSQAANLFVQNLTSNGTYQRMWETSIAAAGTASGVFVGPLDTWRLLVQNTSATATTFILVIIATETGSS